MRNRLGQSLSPYLRQHASNPVAWWEWGPEAFEEARERDLPILLSVGYAACHWCHVMAHESFADEHVAGILNEHFVAIKVDREERPDIDAVYLAATTAMTGRAGWPMTCFLTPTGEPFYAGTYYPKPQFLQLLEAVRHAWSHRRADVHSNAGQLTAALRETAGPPRVELSPQLLEHAQELLAAQFDEERGGFGDAPKFPPSMVLEWLLRRHARTGSPQALRMASLTCSAMARGGVYDQLAGGFARYSVDADWVVPHFEKMLYDNAQLLAVYAHLWRLTGDETARRVAQEIGDFLITDLGTDQGAFASALDADAAGIEGLTYAWTPAQLLEVLGEADGQRAAQLLSVTDKGTFEHGTSTLQLRADPTDATDTSGRDGWAWWIDVRRRLLRARADRPQPARDDKVVTSWNGLAIGALAEAGALLERPDFVLAARRCADVLLERHIVDGRLRRASLGEAIGTASGVADDYGNLASGLLALYQAIDPAAPTTEATPTRTRYLAAAGALLDVAARWFRADDGGFYDTASDADALVIRPRGHTDNAEPSGQSSLALALLTYGALTGSEEHLAVAADTLSNCAAIAAREPRFAGWALAGMEALAAGPLQVAIVHPPTTSVQGSQTTGQTDDQAAQALLQVARRSGSPGLVIDHGVPDAAGVPLLADRPLVNGHATAYVCRGFVCDAPITDPDALATALNR